MLDKKKNANPVEDEPQQQEQENQQEADTEYDDAVHSLYESKN
jgi:hypothetical protein